MKISKKIYFSFGIMLVLLIGTMGYSIIMQQNQVEITEDIIQNKNKKMKLANDVIDIVNFNALFIRNAIIINTKSETQSAKSKINANIEKGTIIFVELGKITNDQESKILIDNFKASRTEYVKDLKKTIELLESNKTAETSKYFSEHLINSHNEALNAAYKFLDYQTKLAENAGQTSLSNSKTIELMTIIFIVVSTIISLLLIYSMIKTIVNPIDKLIGISNEIAVGKFDANLEYDKQDEIGNLYSTFKSVVNNLNKIKSELNAISSSVNSGNLNSSIDVATYKGGWKEIVIDANNLISDLSKPYSSIQGVMSNIAIGIIPKSIENTYKGEFYNIFDNINKLIVSQNSIIELTNNISNGDLSNKIELRSEDDTLMISLQGMTDNLIKVTSTVRDIINEVDNCNLSIRIQEDLLPGEFNNIAQGLQDIIDTFVDILNSTSNIMLGNKDAHISFMNKQVTALLRSKENEIRGKYADFSVSKLIGMNIDRFHVNPEHNRNVLSNLNSKHHAQINLAGQIFNLTITPIFKSNGERKGYIVEWLDYTPEANFANFLNETALNISNGNLSYRLDESKLDKQFKPTALSINKMLNAAIEPLLLTSTYLRNISNGEIPELISTEYLGDFNNLKESINSLIKNINGTISEINNLVKNAEEGVISARGDSTKFNGDWSRMINGINSLVDELLNPINEAVEVLQEMAEGNLSTSMKGNYKGDHAILKNSINQTLALMPFKEAISILQKLSEGDLTSKMTGEYKGDSLNLKNAINETIDSINDILSQVIVSIEEVSRGSLQVSDASSSLSQGATEQAASLEEITSSMSEIGSQTNANASSASEAMNLTNYAKTSAEKGNEQMALLNNAMNEITESSKNISKIIKVIDEIAFQTNLLALNAAVEAARAGRHGKGFAVVAEEVRNLAARSASAAKETAEMIEESIKVIQNGAAIAINTGGALEEIKDGAIKAADIVKEIAKSSQEQAQGIAQINEGLHQIDRVTQTNTASAEQSASAAEELSGQSINLKQMISRFKIANSNYNSHYNDVVRKETYNSNFSNATYKSTPQRQNLNDFLDLESDDFGRY